MRCRTKEIHSMSAAFCAKVVNAGSRDFVVTSYVKINDNILLIPQNFAPRENVSNKLSTQRKVAKYSCTPMDHSTSVPDIENNQSLILPMKTQSKSLLISKKRQSVS